MSFTGTWLELSLKVLELSLEIRNCTEDERQHLRTVWTYRQACTHMELLLVSPEEAQVEAASLYLLAHCRTGHHGPKFCILKKRQEMQPPFHFVVRLCLHDCIAFTECRHWHLCTILFASCFTFRRKTLLNQGSWGVFHKWLTFDLSELYMESHQQLGLFQG